MPTGHVRSDWLPVVPVELAGLTVEVAIDTGFDGGLQLPASWQATLATQPFRMVTYLLGTGLTSTVITYRVKVTIDGDEFETEAFFSPSDEYLIGLDLLRDFRLTIDFPAGTVLLERAQP